MSRPNLNLANSVASLHDLGVFAHALFHATAGRDLKDGDDMRPYAGKLRVKCPIPLTQATISYVAHGKAGAKDKRIVVRVPNRRQKGPVDLRIKGCIRICRRNPDTRRTEWCVIICIDCEGGLADFHCEVEIR